MESSRFNSEIHHRFSTRMKGYDYRRPNYYFITICTKNRECLFGEIVKGKMILNQYGIIVERCWKTMFSRISYVHMDSLVVMPNHIHGIIGILPCRGVAGAPRKESKELSTIASHTAGTCYAPTEEDERKPLKGPAPRSLGALIRSYKSLVMRRIRRKDGYEGDLWQRNYHEHIIRNEKSLNYIREYIRDNPLRWDLDRENPLNITLQAGVTPIRT